MLFELIPLEGMKLIGRVCPENDPQASYCTLTCISFLDPKLLDSIEKNNYELYVEDHIYFIAVVIKIFVLLSLLPRNIVAIPSSQKP